MPSDDTDYKQKLGVEIAAGNKIDLISFWGLQQNWMDSGTIITINDLLKKYKDKTPNINKLPEEAWAGTKKLEDVWGFPGKGEMTKPGKLNVINLNKNICISFSKIYSPLSI